MCTPPNNGTKSFLAQVVKEIDKLKGELNTEVNLDDLKNQSTKEAAELERYRNDTELKTKLTKFVVCFTSGWSIAMLILLFLQAFRQASLSDNVLIILFTETLAIILGLPGIVTSHFFPKINEKDIEARMKNK